jgi:site-specific recombinase XerD
MKNVSADPETGAVRRHHVFRRTFQGALKRAATKAQIHKRVTCHTLRHSFATHLLLHGTSRREIQELLFFNDTATTEIYTHGVRDFRAPATSPLDRIGKSDDAA